MTQSKTVSDLVRQAVPRVLPGVLAGQPAPGASGELGGPTDVAFHTMLAAIEGTVSELRARGMLIEPIDAPDKTAGPLRLKYTEAVIKGIAPVIRDYIDGAIAGLLRDAGVWREGISYGAGALVTHGGTLWAAHTATMDKPGSSSAWRMMAKTSLTRRDVVDIVREELAKQA